jgi:hypothetical protein
MSLLEKDSFLLKLHLRIDMLSKMYVKGETYELFHDHLLFDNFIRSSLLVGMLY